VTTTVILQYQQTFKLQRRKAWHNVEIMFDEKLHVEKPPCYCYTDIVFSFKVVAVFFFIFDKKFLYFNLIPFYSNDMAFYVLMCC